MANLTLHVDDDVLERAQVRARERGTSLDVVVGEYLARYASAGSEAVYESSPAPRITTDPTAAERRGWTRDELYER